MKVEDLRRLIKEANQLHKAKIFAKPSTGGKINLWFYSKYKRCSFSLPAVPINDITEPAEIELFRKAVEMRDISESKGASSIIFGMDRKRPLSEVAEEWAGCYSTNYGKRGARLAVRKFLEANGEMTVESVCRRSVIKMMDAMKMQNCHNNYVRGIASRFRAFCNWAEQRGYMDRVDTRKLLPPEEFGEVKALNESEMKILAATPCETHPDVKDLFMLGVYTAQRTCEMKNYTFSMLYDGKIKTRQGKTGKFIVIPLSESALNIMRKLKNRRESENRGTEPSDKIFRLPSITHTQRIFHAWLAAAGLKGKITLHNSRSTAISMLINKGVPESVTQELANHADPRITARYYRQIDDTKKREALDLISEF